MAALEASVKSPESETIEHLSFCKEPIDTVWPHSGWSSGKDDLLWRFRGQLLESKWNWFPLKCELIVSQDTPKCFQYLTILSIATVDILLNCRPEAFCHL